MKILDSKPRILVCGGRDYTDWLCLSKTLDDICLERDWVLPPDEYGNWLPNVVIISGMARGADSLAVDWAVLSWCDFLPFPADWKQHGRKAGSIRNQQMLDEGKPDLVVAFPGGSGTADMIRRAKKSGIEVLEVK